MLEPRRRFERRLWLARALVVGLFAVLLAREVQLAWMEHARFARMAAHNRVRLVPILPVRGEIFDREGRGLAVNRTAFRVVITPEIAGEKAQEVLNVVARALGWGDARLARMRARMARARPDRPVLLADRLAWGKVAWLAARLHRLPGLGVEAAPYRAYPAGPVAAHIVGYLSLAGPEDLRRGYLATEYVGRTGAERRFEARLHGRLGWREIEVDARGRRVAVLNETPPTRGQDVRLALDLEVQRAAWQALGPREGAVVVLDVQTGDVIAMVSRPSFDPNAFVGGLRWEQWQALRRDPRKPLMNRAYQAAYPPGSVFKVITAMAGMRAELPLVHQRITCTGAIHLADRDLRCWRKEGHGRVGLVRALVESCDVYFYLLGDALGMERLSEEAARWGLGEKTGIPLAGEQAGVIPAKHPYLTRLFHRKLRGRRRNWYRGETMITAIGQGAVTATPLQIARLMAALANGGKLLRPKLALDAAPRVMRTISVPFGALARLHRALRGVVADPRGTAHAAFLHVPWPVAGKTGTAEVDKAHDVAHAWFAGFAPADRPRYAFAVIVERGGHGGAVAAPVAAAVVRALARMEARLREAQR